MNRDNKWSDERLAEKRFKHNSIERLKAEAESYRTFSKMNHVRFSLRFSTPMSDLISDIVPGVKRMVAWDLRIKFPYGVVKDDKFDKLLEGIENVFKTIYDIQT